MAAFYLDNDIDIALATLLSASGHTATTAHDQHLQRAPDAEHLFLAAQNEWIMVTRNANHFRVLHEAWRLWTAAWGSDAIRRHPHHLPRANPRGRALHCRHH
jgi:hypothetical protein